MKIFIALYLSFTLQAWADTMEHLETVYHTYQVRIEVHQATIGSVQLKLNALLDRIDAEKSGTHPDDETLTELLANALELTDQIDEHNRTIQMLGDSISMISNRLIPIYSARIDSTRRCIESESDNDHRRKLEQERLSYVLKRMQVSPLLPKLSFDPAVLESLSLNAVKTEAERKIYADFLNRAFLELRQHYEMVSELEANVVEMNNLEKKAVAFLDEVEDGMLMPVADRAYTANQPMDVYGEATYGTSGNFPDQVKKLADYDHIRSVIYLNHQLNGLSDSQNSTIDPENMTSETYLKILKETRLSLEQILDKTKQKLGNEIADE